MDDEVNWRLRGRCSQPDTNPEIWFSTQWAARRYAQHQCLMHCPVLQECQIETLRFSPQGVVMGGIIWPDTSSRSPRMTVGVVDPNCPDCKRGEPRLDIDYWRSRLLK